MPRMKVMDVVFDLGPLNSFRQFIEKGGKPSAGNPFQVALDKGAILYRNFLTARFIRFASGGGNWAPLKATTKKKKALRTPGSEKYILRETDEIFDHLMVKKIGGINYVGVWGRATHTYSKVSITRLANIHQSGNYPNSQGPREIVVPPDEPTRTKITELVRGAASVAARRSNEERRRVR